MWRGWRRIARGALPRPAALFERVLEAHRDDGPSQTMLARCRLYENQPPAVDWDGIYTASEK